MNHEDTLPDIHEPGQEKHSADLIRGRVMLPPAQNQMDRTKR